MPAKKHPLPANEEATECGDYTIKLTPSEGMRPPCAECARLRGELTTANMQANVDAESIRALKDEVARLNARIEDFGRTVAEKQDQIQSLTAENEQLKADAGLKSEAAAMARGMTAQADAVPATKAHWCSEVPDDDAGDPRPPFDAILGWNTPEVLAWGQRQQALNVDRNPRGVTIVDVKGGQ